MLFEMNENPKVSGQLLGHRDVKTTITVYNSVYIRNTTEKLNEKIKEVQMYLDNQKRKEDIENRKEDLISRMTDEEYNDLLMQLLEERKQRKHKKEEDMEM